MGKVFAWLLFCQFLSLCMHELGHMFLCLLTRMEIKNIHIGIGPQIIRIGKVIFCLLPIMGYVECKIDLTETPRFKMILVAIGGCIANIGLCIIGFLWNRGVYSTLLFIVNFFMAIFSLLPFNCTDMSTLISFLKENNR